MTKETMPIRVVAPAVALIVIAVFGIFHSGLGLVNGLIWKATASNVAQTAKQTVESGMGFVDKAEQLMGTGDEAGSSDGKPSEPKTIVGYVYQILDWVATIESGVSTVGIIWNAIGLICNGMILVGAYCMIRLKSYPLALVGSVMAMIPGVSPFCCLGIPFGIWALVVLCQSDLRLAFAKSPTGLT